MAFSDVFNFANVFSAFDAGKDASNERSQPVRICVGVDPETPIEVVETVREALVPETPHAVVVVSRIDPAMKPKADPGADVALVLCGGNLALCHDWGSAWLSVDVPTLMIGRSAVEVPACTLGGRVAQRVCASSADELLSRVGHWMIDATEKDVAFAANFPFCRRAVAMGLIRAVAFSNATVCAFGFLPGIVDFTMVTANELKLALDIAAVYDKKMTMERLPEIFSVVLFGATIRTIASAIERFVPKLTWLVNGVAGYSGALITGNALVAHFEDAMPLPNTVEALLSKVKDAAEVVSERVETLTGEVIKLGPGATYRHPKETGKKSFTMDEEIEEAEPAPEPGWVELGPYGTRAVDAPL